ncbi:MAG: family 16 glycosylhydrolase [Woeseiaceae bacterium]|nr:family 16 glycosylhydrolase [Woeseiaceae bacterium]
MAALCLLSACESNRSTPLTAIETIDVPVADTTTRTNFNTDSPTLEIPDTFAVRDGDLLTLVWSDEFDDAQLDPELWFFESGDGSQFGIPGWGNEELQWYLPDNARLEDGKLIITAKRETVVREDGNFDYTSARINTRDRFAVKYGRIEASIKLPSGQGLWPAFWMLAQDSPYGNWPSSGEIDIMEAVNLDGTPGIGGIGGGNEIFGTLHFGGGPFGRIIDSSEYTPSPDVTEDFHTYAVEWDEFEIRWYFDGILYGTKNSWVSDAAPYPAPFDQPFYILLNVAVGGNFPGSPNSATPFPATMEVDYVRVYSGQEPAAAPVDPGVIPEDVVYSSDPINIPENFGPPGGIQDFGSGAGFANVLTDPSFSRVLRVTSGDAYDPGVVDVGFAAFTGYDAGFGTAYETLVFKAKGDAANLSNFEVKFVGAPGDPETSVVYDVTTYTDLGSGWYQVTIPMSDFAASLATNTAFLLGPVGDQGAPFSFQMTDIGFSTTAVGPADPGLIPDDVIYATDPNETVDLVTTISPFGTTSQFEGMYALDPDFNPAFEAQSGSGYGLDNIVQLGFVDLPMGFATGYESFLFKIKSDDLPGNTIVVKLEGGGGEYGDVVLTDTNVSTPLGNGWYQVVLPMADFTNVADAVGVLFERVGPQNADGGMPFSMLVTDIGFNNPTVGMSIIPDDVIYATDPNEMVDLVATISAFGTTSMFDGAYALDPDYNPAFEAQSGNGYGLDNIVQLGFIDLPMGFATGYESFVFKIKSSDLPGNTVVVKLEGGGGEYGDVVLTDTNVSTPLGNGWYQVVLPMADFTNVADAVGILFERVGPQNADGGMPFSMLLTDIGFNNPVGGTGNLITNGGFETGLLDPWADFGNGMGTITVSAAEASEGTNSVNIVAGDSQTVFLRQSGLGAGTVMNGDTLNISFDLKGTATDVPVLPTLEGTGVIETITAVPADWMPFTYQVTLGADFPGGVFFEIGVPCGPVPTCSANIFIDNVIVTIQ